MTRNFFDHEVTEVLLDLDYPARITYVVATQYPDKHEVWEHYETRADAEEVFLDVKEKNLRAEIKIALIADEREPKEHIEAPILAEYTLGQCL